MKRARLVLRVIFSLAVIVILVQLAQKEDKSHQSIVEFKLKTAKKILVDSLGVRQTADTVFHDTGKFLENSPGARRGISALTMIGFTWFLTELFFLVRASRKSKQEYQNQ